MQELQQMQGALKNRNKYIAFIQSTGLGKDDAEDIIQNVMITCFQKGIWEDRYIWAGIRNQIITERTMANRYIHPDRCPLEKNNQTIIDSISVNPVDTIDKEFLYSKYIELVESLNNKEQEIMELKLSGNTLAEISAKTGININNVKRFYYKNIKKLTRYLD